MTKDDLVARSEKLINKIDGDIGEFSVAHEPRIIVSATLCNLGRQHHRAIVRLIASNLLGSAAALMRVIFECYVRSVWIHDCATDDEVNDATDDKWPRMAAMVQAIESTPNLKTGVLGLAFDARWKAFNSFTHNGSLALSRQIKGHSIEPTFSDEDLSDMAQFADSMGLMLAAHAAVLSKNTTLASSLLEKVREYTKGEAREEEA
jgi:hypothetical protein